MKYLKKYKLFEEKEEDEEVVDYYNITSTSGDYWLLVNEYDFDQLVKIGYVEEMAYGTQGEFKDEDYQRILDFLDMQEAIGKYNL